MFKNKRAMELQTLVVTGLILALLIALFYLLILNRDVMFKILEYISNIVRFA